MKRYKLKRVVKRGIFILSMGVITSGLILSYDLFSNNKKSELQHVSSEVVESNKTIPVVKQNIISLPYTLDTVKINKNYYNKDESEENQINSLLYYKDTYMQNTGVLYTGEAEFDVVSVLDGEVTSVTKDEILGNVVEVSHSTNLITIYECLGEVSVKPGDKISQGDKIGKSGSVDIDEGYGNALIFEVNLKGEIINPNDFYVMDPSKIEA